MGAEPLVEGEVGFAVVALEVSVVELVEVGGGVPRSLGLRLVDRFGRLGAWDLDERWCRNRAHIP